MNDVHESHPSLSTRLSRWFANNYAVVGTLLFLGYVYSQTFSRELTSGTNEDPGQLMLKAVDFEVAHSNGYPLFMLLLLGTSSVVPPSCYILVANSSSALFAVLTLFFIALIYRMLGLTQWAISLTLLLIGLTRSFWGQSIFCEVYHFSNATFFLLLLGMCVHLSCNSLWTSFAVGLLSGLQFTNHLLSLPAVLLVLGTCLWVMLIHKDPSRRLVLLFLGVLLGLSPYLYIPASWIHHDIPVSEGFVRTMKLGVGGDVTFPGQDSLLVRWSVGSQILLRDVGLFVVIASICGLYALLFRSRCLQSRALALVVAVGGVALPLLYLLRFRPWFTGEILAFYLFPSLCLQFLSVFAFDYLITTFKKERQGRNFFGGSIIAGVILLLLFVGYSRFRDNYVLTKQEFGDLRFSVLRQTLRMLQPGDALLSYTVFGRFDSYELIAYSESLRGRLEWSPYYEHAHRRALEDREAVETMLRSCQQRTEAYYLLTDSAELVIPRLEEEGHLVQILLRTSSHEHPEIARGEDGNVSLRPRNLLEAMSGKVVWELGIGFPSGHAVSNFSFDWFGTPSNRLLGQIVFINDYVSRRYSRQRIFEMGAVFGGKDTAEEMHLKIDPFNHVRPEITWLPKEPISVPFALYSDSDRLKAGLYSLDRVLCRPPFDGQIVNSSIEYVLIRVIPDNPHFGQDP